MNNTINWIEPSRGGASKHANHSLFRLSNQRGGGNDRTQSVIFIHEKAMKELRWVIGDRVVFAHEPGTVYLKRVPTKGFALSSAVGGKSANFAGKMASANVKSSKHAFDFDGVIYVNEFSIDGDVVKLTYKKQA